MEVVEVDQSRLTNQVLCRERIQVIVFDSAGELQPSLGTPFGEAVPANPTGE